MLRPVSDDPAVIRATLTDAGIDVPARGRISAENLAEYERLRQDGVTSANFDDDPDDDDDQGAAPGDEQVPRGQREQARASGQGRAASAARGLWGRAKQATAGGGKKRAGGKKHAWVGTSDVIEHFWSQLAWAARPLPPMQKILAAQAPTAGVVLQDALRDTVIDRVVLQPAARLEDRLQAVNAMAGPPIWVMGITAFGGAATDPQTGLPLIGPDGEFIYDDRTRLMVGGLRFSLMSWLRIADKHVDEIKAGAEELTRLGDEADELIRWILAPPQPGATPKDVEREAGERAAAFIAGGQPDRPAPPDPAAFASSAFSPRPTAGTSGGSA
jgi:hypothetical protein